MAVLALGLLANLSQLYDGVDLGVVIISIMSPFSSCDDRGITFPLFFAAMQVFPMFSCILYAKSTGVDPAGRVTRSFLGVNTNISPDIRLIFRSSRMSLGSVESKLSCRIFLSFVIYSSIA